jgi:hypothetical protein
VSKIELGGTLLVRIENLTDQSHGSSAALPKQRDPQTRLLKAMTRPSEHARIFPLFWAHFHRDESRMPTNVYAESLAACR